MLTVYKYAKGIIKKGELTDLKKPSTLTWADVNRPSKEELNKISEETGITPVDLKEAIDEAERPRTSDLTNYSLLTFRAPLYKNGDIRTPSVSIFIFEKRRPKSEQGII